ncbi:MAG: alpha-galactosidase, partial [Armatimonadetes bacterium]|nr:alpha-galactosidase [Armatimonadota bacterium]
MVRVTLFAATMATLGLLAQASTGGGGLVATVSPNLVVVRAVRMGDVLHMKLDLPEGLSASTRSQKGELELLVISKLDHAVEVRWEAQLTWGKEPYPCRLGPGRQDDGLLQLEVGGASTELCNGLYSRFEDRALELSGGRLRDGDAAGTYAYAGRTLVRPRQTATLLALRVHRDFYRKERGIRYFAPIDKSVFKHPQAGWCSWYYYYRRVTEEDMVKNAQWLGRNLRKFGLRWIQVDDGWQAKGTAASRYWRDWRAFDPEFPHGMKWLAEQIKKAGFQAGLWLTPHATNAKELVQKHPAWFVRDKDDHYFDAGWVGHYLIDPTHPEVREVYLRRLFERMTREWGFDYFKIDGQPTVISYYGKLAKRLHQPIEGDKAYRLSLETIRAVLGPQRFLLGCWGTPVQGIGYMNGSRTGGDVVATWRGMWPGLRATERWYFLHNVCWYCDPDCLCVRPPMTLEEARVWATLYAITGQHLMLSDYMPALPAERVETLKRILPVADVRPMDLYARKRIDVAHLRIRKPLDGSTQGAKPKGPRPQAPRSATWSVVAEFNWGDRLTTRTLDLQKLGLPASGAEQYVLYDFWHRKTLGVFVRSAKLVLPARSVLLLGVRRFDGRPSLAGIDRHITQGAVSLLDLEVRDEASARVISGKSELVAAEPYRMAFVLPRKPRRWKLVEAKADVACEHAVEGHLLWVTLKSSRGGACSWRLRFAATTGEQPKAAGTVSLKATRHRAKVVLTWEPSPGLRPAYYRVLRNGQGLGRTGVTGLEDWWRGEA